MAPIETTTLRVPKPLRDEIARLADERGTSMLEVVTEAVRKLRRDAWWADLRIAFDAMPPDDATGYEAETLGLDGAIGDGLHGR